MNDSTELKSSEFQRAMTEVLSLQLSFSSSNTEPMRRRGELVRRDIPHLLSSEYLKDLRLKSGISDLEINGSDGVGLKSEIPYIRIFSKELSSRPTMGWYVVVLFDATGDGFYLSLCHASTKNDSHKSGTVQFTPRSKNEMKQLMHWAENTLSLQNLRIAGTVREITLGSTRSNLGRAYEDTTLIAFRYSKQTIPSLSKFRSDLGILLPLLKKLYEAQLTDPTQPGEPSPELVATIEEIEVQATGRALRTGRRQGFGLTQIERKVVEERAVQVAIEYYKNLGYTKIDDVGAFESYDLRVTGPDGVLFVEVKGTTSHGESIILTRNEVELHRREFPSNALVVVSLINLIKGETPKASGGILNVTSPWELISERLTPLGFEYDLRQ